jgi:CDP-glucose 4,6-dehydratase
VSDSSFWEGRPTLITGANGLVGTWLVRRLLGFKANIVCLVRDWVPQRELMQPGMAEQVTVVRGDVCDQALLENILREHGITTVIHLAAQTVVGVANRNPMSTYQTNIGGTWALLEACRLTPTVKQIVLASSDKAYGDQKILPYDEESPLQGTHPYDVSKSCADLLAQSYAATYGLPVVVTRCGNFYGGGDLNWNRIVPGTIRSILREQRPVLRSDGSNIRDYFYVEDGAAAYTMLAEKLAENPGLRGHAFNFSHTLQVTVLELVERILTLMDSDLKPDIRNEATNEILHQYLSAEKAHQLLGWQPLYTLEQGLQLTIQWYREFLGAGVGV